MATEKDKTGYPQIRDTKTAPIGTSGIDISGNRFYEEYLPRLTGTERAEEYDKMRRSDDQITLILHIVKNPILSARWFMQPASQEEKDKKIAEFMQYILFEDMGTHEHPKTFTKFLREALTSIDFGYSLFELTNKVVFDDEVYGTYLGIKGLDWRSPKTIEEWYIDRDGTLLKVRQDDYSQRADTVYMPGKFLLHIAPEMEGDLYEGISMLRPIYGNYIRKDFWEKIDMIGGERASTGVPIGRIPRGQENSDAQKVLEDSLSRFVAHEQQYITVPEGFEIDSLKIDHDGEAIDRAIRRQNQGMAKSVLAGFMELGLSGSSGSWALGSDLSDIFLAGIQVYAKAISDNVNAKVIRMLVDQNFGRQRKYPKLAVEGINDKAGKEFAEVLQILSGSDLIEVTDDLQRIIHQRYKLPEIDIKGTKKTPDKKSEAKKLAEIYYSLAERNISQGIEKKGKDLSEMMSKNMKRRGGLLVNGMMTIYKNISPAKRRKEVNKLQVPGKNEYKELISDQLAGIYVNATAAVKSELSGSGLKLAEESEIKALPSDSKAAAASQADLIVESQDADIRKNLFFSFTTKVDILPTEAQMEANLLKVVKDYVTGPSVRVAGPNAVSAAVNTARNAIFQEKKVFDSIESFIFMNPSPEAAICKELAGRVFTKEEYVTSNKLPPLHHNCNSWIKAQISGRKGNKPVSPAGLSIQGTPSQIEEIEKSIKF